MIALTGLEIGEPIYETAKTLVYRAIRTSDARPVILKVLNQDYPTPSQLARYKQEYEIIRALDVEGAVKVYGLEPYQNSQALILEDFGGDSLQHLDLAPLELTEFLKLAIAISTALGQIHDAAIVHKDINPANIVLNPKTEQLKIIDFGIATQLSQENPTLKNPNVLEGTLAYISPEQTGRMNRSLDYRTDFYSIGVTFYELLTGRRPFDSHDPMELVHAHIAKPPTPPNQVKADIPQMISDLVMKLMAKNAEDRYQSAWGIKADLDRCLADLEARGEISEFSLGMQDFSERFQIPQKLYGREKEIDRLLAAFERVVGGADSVRSQSETILISGYSGVGKSSLVHEIYKPITEKRGYFLSGKFDQFRRNIPYSAVVSAFAGLVRQLLSETEEQLDRWRHKLLSALEPNGQVIVDMIPEVELIIGPQPPVPELDATENLNRFNLVFQNFIRAFCSPQHPLVIFLDDLQWVDSASLKLIQLMVTDARTPCLFFIGAYRNNEVSASHPLTIALETLLEEGAAVHQILLVPLRLEHIGKLLADTLHSQTETVKLLAELTIQKTEGNPFFVSEFLKTLYAENLIAFDREQGIWQWDLGRIQAAEIADNVAELTVDKLKKLPDRVLQVLQLAACIGANFDLTTLAMVCERSPMEIFPNLKVALQAGLILPTSELDSELLIQNYKFSHDRIQQAAYSFIEEADRELIHFKIGSFLLENTDPQHLSEELFNIVDRLNLGHRFFTAREDLQQLAELNLMAGRKAKAATAYAAAIDYLSAGFDFLSNEKWQRQYDLTLNLYAERVEAEYLNGNYSKAEMLSRVAIQNSKTIFDRICFYEIEIKILYMVKAQYKEALETGLEILKLLDVDLEQAPPQISIQELNDLPEMTDPHKLVAMQFLSSLIPPAYIADPVLLSKIVFTQIHLCRQYGNSMLAAHAYSLYGTILCATLEGIDLGYQFALLSLDVLERFDSDRIKAKVLTMVEACVRHWKEPLHKTVELAREGIKSGLETGDLEYFGYSIIHYCSHCFFLGKPLEDFDDKLKNYANILEELQQDYASTYLGGLWQLALILREQNSMSFKLVGEVFDGEKMATFFLENKRFTTLFYLSVLQSLLCYFFKNYREAVDCASRAANYARSSPGLLVVREHNFYYSLALLAVCRNTESDLKTEYLERVETNQQNLKIWARHAPENCQQQYELVEAEKARVLGEYWQAAELYERAISLARQNGYIHEEALASELAAEFYLERGMESVAQTYLKGAHYNYSRWQARAKVKDLEQRYPQFFQKSSLAKSESDVTTTSNSTSSTSSMALDLTTVVKAARAISGEIVLDKLLVKLMKLLVENAGAQWGCLILLRDGQLSIEASGKVDDENVTLLQAVPVENRLPLSIVNYVARTRETVVFNDAIAEIHNPTSHIHNPNDPYINQNQPKSILCTPLVNQGQLGGMVYLENNLSTGAFTRDRLEVVNLITAQAAISIENAQLYRNLERANQQLEDYSRTLEVKVEERTAELKHAKEAADAANQAKSEFLSNM
ncbi:MAG: AAA family ATPase, partial [Cyanobacteria bacterium SBC]|nr:AAA family ATPase [Cyanobacteria bacterium SBC]